MKLIICIILTLVNCNVGSSAVNVAKRTETFNENQFKTSFTDLDEDCLFIILENLNLGDLINVAQIDDAHSMLASKVFRCHYSYKWVRVSDYFKFSQELDELMNTTDVNIDTDTIEQINSDLAHLFNKTPNIEVERYYFELRDYDSIYKTFKYFGHLIKDLNTESFSFTPLWHTKLIGYLISEYSSESLVDITFANQADILLKYITKPLIKTEHVKFDCTLVEFKTPIIGFCERFPAVRHLYLNTLSDDNLVDLNCHMPHLEYVSMSRFYRNRSFVPDIIIKNPQIKSITLDHADAEFLQKMNTLLPQLQTLKLERFSLQNGSIQFDNVTTLYTDYAEFTSPLNLRFPRLQTFHSDCLSLSFHEYLAFLNQHKFLSHLYLKGYFMDDSQFLELTANLKDLVKITLEIPWHIRDRIQNINTNAVLEFLRSHDKVKQLDVINHPKAWIDGLQEQLKHEWIVKTIDKGVAFLLQ